MSAPAALPCPYARAPDIHHLALPTCPAPASRPAGVPATDPRSRGPGSQWPPKTLRSPQSRRPHPPLDSARRARAAAGAAREAGVPAPGKAPRPPRAPAPRAALAAYVLRCAPAPRRPPVPLRPARVHPVTPGPGGRAGGRVGAGPCEQAPGGSASAPPPSPRAPGRALTAGSGGRRRPQRSGSCVSARGSAPAPAARAQSRGSRPAARSAVAAGARRARVRAGPAAATGAPCRRRCRRLW